MSDPVYDYIVRELTAECIDNNEHLYNQVQRAARDAVRDDMGTGADRDAFEQALRGGRERPDYEHAVGAAVVEVIRDWLDGFDDNPAMQLLRSMLDLGARSIADRLGEHYLPTDAGDIDWADEESEADDEDTDLQEA